jgi:hypothetical protein
MCRHNSKCPICLTAKNGSLRGFVPKSDTVASHHWILGEPIQRIETVAHHERARYDWDLWMAAGIDSDGNIERYRKAIKNELRKNSKNILNNGTSAR